MVSGKFFLPCVLVWQRRKPSGDIMSSFFRKEALAYQRHKLDGDVIIATPMPFNVILAIIVLIVVFGLFYLFWGEYHRKEVVAGYLRPASG